MGMAPGVMPFVSLVVEVLGGGMGMAPAGVSHASRVAEVMGRGMGMAPAVMSFVSLLVGVLGRGMGMAPAGYALGLAAGGGNGRYHALVLSGAEVNPPESLLVL